MEMYNLSLNEPSYNMIVCSINLLNATCAMSGEMFDTALDMLLSLELVQIVIEGKCWCYCG